MEPPRRYPVASPQLMQNPSNASRTTEGPKPVEWEAVKDEIKLLYDRYPLKEVKRILEHRGFCATERMFKSRLSQWGFNKNSSDKEYQVAALQLEARKAAGKPATVFIINANTRTVKDLRKYIKGRKMSDDKFLVIARQSESAGILEEVQDHVRCETPDPDLDADVKQSPESATSNSGGSPPPKQSPPLNSSSSPSLVPGQMKLETYSDSPSMQNYNPTSYTPCTLYAEHKHRRDSIKIRKKRASDSSMEAMMPSHANIPEYQHRQMEGVQYSHQHVDPTNERNTLKFDAATQEPGLGMEFTQPFYTPRHSPTCEHFESEVDMLAQSTLYSKPLPSSFGTDNLEGFKLLNPPAPDSPLNDYDVICGRCHQSTTSHFSSLQHVNDSPRSSGNLQQPAAQPSPRAILSPADGVSIDAFQVAPSAKDHDHCFRFVSLSFLACIYATKQQASLNDTIAPGLARKALDDAGTEFEAALRSDDPMIILALNHTLTILHMHEQKDICEKIMKNAAAVAERVVGLYHPVGVIARFLGYASNPKKLREQTEITSQVLRNAWDQCRQKYDARERDMRSIGVMYCLGYMLNVEGGRDEDGTKLLESEFIIRSCYELSCEKMGKNNLQSIMAMTNLRLNMERQNRTNEAIECAQIAIHDSKETLGTQHPKRLELMRNLALSYIKIGRDGEAEQLYWKVLEGRINMLGRQHNFTLAMKDDLRYFLKDRKRWRNANGEPSRDHLKLEDMFSWEMVEADGAEEDAQGVMSSAQKQLKAF